ncbi:hypothetical protein NPX13_g6272 [Xylaria arbuscula]|uniref:Uncharacterized protein n=1 Tax=Xylaria arbuscula TaxID=114810 RepID=A0A9W8TKJ2_9PEZI|nr:hypothetical protein NPX13_g6272 [Xylaria arbuscula]
MSQQYTAHSARSSPIEDEDTEVGGVALREPPRDGESEIPLKFARKLRRKQNKKEKWKVIKAQWAKEAAGEKAAGLSAVRQ